MNNSFEQEIKNYFIKKNIRFSDDSSSYHQLDFTIFDKGEHPVFHFDAKEKRQKYNLTNWPEFTPETDLFIIDDLAVRKSLAFAPKSGIMIRDNIRVKYFFLSIIDLALMPKKRVNRPINKTQLTMKGKWLISLRNGKEFDSFDDAISHLRLHLRSLNTYLFETLECYGDYVGENIDTGGIVRKPSHWDTDVQGTR